MDEDELDHALERWTQAGLLDEETARAIHTFEAERGAGGFLERRLSRIVATMGAVLIAVGLITYLAAAWDELSTAARTAILILAPLSSAGAGFGLDRRELPLAGRSLWIVSTLLLGPSFFLLGELHAPELHIGWILLAWGVVALPMGHAFLSRAAVGIGLAAVLLALFALGSEHTGIFVASAAGALIVLATAFRSARIDHLVNTYRIVSVAPTIALFLWLATLDGRLGRVVVVYDAYLAGGVIVAIAAVTATAIAVRQNRAEHGDVLLAALCTTGVVLALALVRVEGLLPEMLGYLLVHGVLLVVLIGIALAGVLLEAKTLINLVALGFLLQVATLFVTVADQLPETLALIVVGMALLVVAILLERGRRQLLDRIGT